MAIDLNRLAKIWKLTTSPNAGEAAAARNRAKAIVEREGKTLADIPGLLGKAQQAKGPTPGAAGFTFYDMTNPDHVAAYAAKQAEIHAARSAREAPEREEVLARYGGTVDDVLAWTEKESILRAAVAKWSVSQEPPHQRWTKSIDGIDMMENLDKLSLRARRALSNAYPLPTTITAAAEEYRMWEKRDRDVGLAVEATDDTQLDLPVYFRREIVRELLETKLRARDIGEVLIRQRHMIDSQMSMPEIDQAVLLDLEGLVEQQAGGPQPKATSGRTERPAKFSQPDMFT